MLRTSLLLVVISLATLGCAKAKTPVTKPQSRDVPSTRTIEKAAKPSPYKPKAPRQVSAVNRENVPPVTSAARNERPQPE